MDCARERTEESSESRKIGEKNLKCSTVAQHIVPILMEQSAIRDLCPLFGQPGATHIQTIDARWAEADEYPLRRDAVELLRIHSRTRGSSLELWK